MEKYVTNIKDLVVQALTNGSEIKAKAESDDALSCFQMGMIYLLGIDTKIDFKKASNFFQNQSLSEDPDANRILGFIAECEGNYSQAFKNYANASKANIPYLNKVYKERVNLNGFFKKIDLSGSAQNKIITNVLSEYIKGGDTKIDASIRIALICDDEETCLVAAKDLFDAGDYFSAMSWLQNGNVSDNNTLYISVKKKIADSKNAPNLPNTLEVIDIDGNSFLATLDATPSYAGIKNLCDEQTVACKKEWSSIVSPTISAIKKKIENEEAARIKKEKEEEEARRRKDEEAKRKALLLEQEKEEEERKKRNRRNNFFIILGVACLICIFSVSLNNNKVSSSSSSSDNSSKTVTENVKEFQSNAAFESFSLLSTKELSESDLDGKTKKDLEIMRNSIYALHGYIFKRDDLRNYFSQFSWYNPITSDMSEVYNSMNKVEKRNIDFIKKHEK